MSKEHKTGGPQHHNRSQINWQRLHISFSMDYSQLQWFNFCVSTMLQWVVFFNRWTFWSFSWNCNKSKEEVNWQWDIGAPSPTKTTTTTTATYVWKSSSLSQLSPGHLSHLPLWGSMSAWDQICMIAIEWRFALEREFWYLFDIKVRLRLTGMLKQSPPTINISSFSKSFWLLSS